MLGKDGAVHHGSHQDLLDESSHPPERGAAPDAIVVPTIRQPYHLAAAAELAQVLNCTLVTLHSQGETTASRASKLLSADIDLIAIDVRPSSWLRLPRWETSRLLLGLADFAGFLHRRDQTTKRNLALMLSRMLGWSRILFLDDDITGVNPDEIRQATGLLETHNVVGLRIGGFPDHSVVCHAYRLVGGHQKPFVGAGALAIKTERCNSFFPDIYNDDWFFMLNSAGSLQPVARTGEVSQDRFDPFEKPERARSEELGDVLAEGTYWLLDEGKPAFSAGEGYWADFLAKRKRFIERVWAMTERHDLEGGGDKNRMIAALKVSLSQLGQITPELCESYMQAWLRDRDLWQGHMGLLPVGQTRQQALNLLSAPGTPPLTRHLGREQRGHRGRLPRNQVLRSPGGRCAAQASW